MPEPNFATSHKSWVSISSWLADLKNSITVVVVKSDKKLESNFALAAFSTVPKLKTCLQKDDRYSFDSSKLESSPPQIPPKIPSSLSVQALPLQD